MRYSLIDGYWEIVEKPGCSDMYYKCACNKRLFKNPKSHVKCKTHKEWYDRIMVIIRGAREAAAQEQMIRDMMFRKDCKNTLVSNSIYKVYSNLKNCVEIVQKLESDSLSPEIYNVCLEIQKIYEHLSSKANKNVISRKECDICFDSKIYFWNCPRCVHTHCLDCHGCLQKDECPGCRLKID